MDKFSGEDLLLGLYAIQKKAAEAPWALKEHELPKGNWKRVIDPDGEAFCNIVTKNYVIGIKTGRVIFLDKNTKDTVKYVIDKKLRWRVRDMLDQLNMSERIVYPGLEGLSKWIARHYYVK